MIPHNNITTRAKNNLPNVLETFKKVHGDTYDYTNSVYLTDKTKINIICSIHGTFSQTPKNHGLGQGCPKCGLNKRISSRRFTQQEFIEKATNMHNGFYLYDKVKYVNSNVKVTITCPVHGDFEQVANAHVQGQGCPHCGLISQVTSRKYSTGWKYSEWKAAGEQSSNFNGFQLYVIKCWNEQESFLKIGKTYQSLCKRFPTKFEMPYKYQVMYHQVDTAESISMLEHSLQSKYKMFKYSPQSSFSGKTECFSIDILEEILQELRLLANNNTSASAD